MMPWMLRLLALLLCWGVLAPANAATLLPPGRQQFLDTAGAPLAAGRVYFYVPSTTSPKDTYTNTGATLLNTNPVQLDSGGFATIYGVGAYRMIVKNSVGTTIYDQLTADTSSGNSSWAGTSAGSANALSVTASAFSVGDGQTVSWRNGFTNTSAATVTIAGNIYSIVKDTLSGTSLLTGGEMTSGGVSTVTFDSTIGKMHLLVPVSVSPATSIASATTTDLGTLGTTNVNVTGSATIVSLGASANANTPLYFVTFAANTVLTHNATSLIVPGGVNLTTVANSLGVFKYLGSGNWQLLSYFAGLGAASEQVNAQSGVSYTVVAADQGKLVSFANAAAIAVTLPQATGAFPASFWFDAQNVGAGFVTITPTTSTIDGVATLLLPPGYGVRIVSDGANWQISGSNPSKGRILLNTLTASASATLSDITSLSVGFTQYTIEFDELVPATNAVNGRFRIRSGGTFQTTTYVANGFFHNAAGTALTGAITTYIPTDGSTLTVANSAPGITGTITIKNPLQTSSPKMFSVSSSMKSTASPVQILQAAGYWNGGNGAVDGFQFDFSSGNITSGVIRVYGSN